MRLRFIAALLLAPLLLVGAQADQAIWNEFLAWYKTYTGPPYPGDLLKAYTAALLGAGKSKADVDAALAMLRKMGANPPEDMMRMHFNKVFTLHQHLFTHEPNALLVRTVRGLKPGKALDVGMGQGRNAVFLAGQGWDVTGYDFSDEALARARENASKAAVSIRAVQATHEKFDFGKEQWDLIVMTYAFVNMSDRAFLARVKESLRPGGLVLVEQPNSGGPGKGPANALFRSFEDLRVVFYEDILDKADWSKQSTRLGRLVAQRD
ncbi:MAG: class I SAM-dependent methyltransferase [Bryobacteraceae bacterium]